MLSSLLTLWWEIATAVWAGTLGALVCWSAGCWLVARVRWERKS